MQNRVKFKEMEGCRSREENTKDPMAERDTYKTGAQSLRPYILPDSE
jgi:hypothetical protein